MALWIALALPAAVYADDPFELPVVVPAAPTRVAAAADQQGQAVQNAPAPDRWVQRSQRLREAALKQADQSANAFAPPLPAPAPAPTSASPFLTVAQAQVPSAPPVPRRQNGMVAAQQTKTPFAGKMPAEAPQAPTPPGMTAEEQVTRPSQLRKVTAILPYFDYEPDPKVAREDPCQNLCPRPDGAPCKPTNGKGPDCPPEIALSEGAYQPRTYAPSLYAWEASNICYNPLYFEDPSLERYGHSWPWYLQPAASTARFAIQAIGLPYQMTIDPPCSAVYPLGYYRPGEYAPKLIYQIPWNTHAALVEAGAVTGVFFLFPHSAF